MHVFGTWPFWREALGTLGSEACGEWCPRSHIKQYYKGNEAMLTREQRLCSCVVYNAL